MKSTSGEILVGAAGRATELILTIEDSDPPDCGGTVAGWFLQCPGQSPAWQHYGLSIIHLRPIPGVKDATIKRCGATHEVIIVAYDPKYSPDPENPKTWHWLQPVNYTGQLELPSDEKAKEMLRVLAKAVADGYLWAELPLSGQREPWDTQLRHLEAHAAGKHAN